MSTRTSVAAAIDSINNDMENLRRVKKLMTSGRMAAALRRLDLLPQEFWVYATTGGVQATAYLNELDGMRDPRLTNILDFLQAGEPDDIESDDNAEALNRNFIFRWKGEIDGRTKTLNIVVVAYVKSESPTCHRVEVGKKMQEVVQYKLVCDGDATE